MKTKKMSQVKKFLIFVPCAIAFNITMCLLALHFMPDMTAEKVFSVRQLITTPLVACFWGWVFFLRKRKNSAETA